MLININQAIIKLEVLYLESANYHGSWFSTSQEVIGDASALAEVLKEDLKDSTEKLLDLVEAASVNVSRYGEIQQSKGSLPEKVDVQHTLMSLLFSLTSYADVPTEVLLNSIIFFSITSIELASH